MFVSEKEAAFLLFSEARYKLSPRRIGYQLMVVVISRYRTQNYGLAEAITISNIWLFNHRGALSHRAYVVFFSPGAARNELTNFLLGVR